MLSSAFWNAKTHLSEIFYFNISESQTCSKYYHCQANITNLSPWYMYFLTLVFKYARLLVTPKSSSCCIDFSLIYPKKYFKRCFIHPRQKPTCCFELLSIRCKKSTTYFNFSTNPCILYSTIFRANLSAHLQAVCYTLLIF